MKGDPKNKLKKHSRKLLYVFRLPTTQVTIVYHSQLCGKMVGYSM